MGELLDKLIPQECHVSLGQAIKCMVLNGLGFTNRCLYLTELFFRDKPVERLIGKGIEAAHLNDDTLGLSHYFSSIYNRAVSGLSFEMLSLVEVNTRKSFSIIVKQCTRKVKEEAVDKPKTKSKIPMVYTAASLKSQSPLLACC